MPSLPAAIGLLGTVGTARGKLCRSRRQKLSPAMLKPQPLIAWPDPAAPRATRLKAPVAWQAEGYHLLQLLPQPAGWMVLAKMNRNTT